MGSLPDKTSRSDEVGFISNSRRGSLAQNRSHRRFAHRFFFARPAKGLSFSRSVRRIGVPGSAKVSRMLLVR